MKKSGQVGLMLMTALGLASIARATPTQPLASLNPATPQEAALNWDNSPRDPCAPEYYDQQACQEELKRRRNSHGGFWLPRMTATRLITRHWYCVHPITPVGVSHPPSPAPARGRVARGGFGATAAASHAGTGSRAGS